MLGFSQEASSKVPAFTIITSGAASISEKIGDPHCPQNDRLTGLPESPTE